MKDLIANNAKFVLDYGPYVILLLIAVCIYVIHKNGRGHRFFLPNSLPKWIGSALSLFFIFILALAFHGLNLERQTTGKVLARFESMLNQKAPPLSFTTVTDTLKQNLVDYQGKVVILNLWATWCSPCLKEMPDLNRLHRDFNDVVVIALSDEPQDILMEFSKNNDYEFISVFNSQIEWTEVAIGTARPLTFIIDKAGFIREYHTGVRDYQFYKSRIETLH